MACFYHRVPKPSKLGNLLELSSVWIFCSVFLLFLSFCLFVMIFVMIKHQEKHVGHHVCLNNIKIIYYVLFISISLFDNFADLGTLW